MKYVRSIFSFRCERRLVDWQRYVIDSTIHRIERLFLFSIAVISVGQRNMVDQLIVFLIVNTVNYRHSRPLFTGINTINRLFYKAPTGRVLRY